MRRALALIVLATAVPAAALDLTVWHREREPISAPDDGGCKTFAAWRNVLRFDGVATPVPLAGESECTHDPLNGRDREADRRGLDANTIEVTRLAPNRLVWIRWSTVSLGSGRYIHDGHVILAVDGESLREIFRTNYESYAKSRAGMYESTQLTAAFDAEASILMLVESDEYYQHSADDVGNDWSTSPLTVQEDEGEYFTKLVGRKKWHHRVEGTRLRYLHGREWVDLGDYGFPVDEVARQFEVERTQLLRLNPGRDTKSVWKGRVAVRDLPAYVPDLDDGFCVDKPYPEGN
jgi:hypothetical protein